MSCCNNTLDLGCIDHCGVLSFGTSDGGTFIGHFQSGNISVKQTVIIQNGNPFAFDMSLLNEDMEYNLTIYENGSQVSVTIDSVEYDCFTFRTKYMGISSNVEIPDACTPMCKEIYDPEGVEADVFDYNNMHTGVAVDGVTITGTGQTGDPLVAVGGGGGGTNIYNSDGTIPNGTDRVVTVEGTLYFGTTNAEKSLTIGDTFTVPVGDGTNTITFPVDGVTMFKAHYDVPNSEGHIAAIQTYQSNNNLVSQMVMRDTYENSEAGFFIFHNLGTPSGPNSFYTNWGYTNPTTQEATTFRLFHNAGYQLYPYDVGNPTFVLNSQKLLTVYDVNGQETFRIDKNSDIYTPLVQSDNTLTELLGVDNTGLVKKISVNDLPSGGGSGSAFDCADLIGCNISNLTNDSGYITSALTDGITIDGDGTVGNEITLKRDFTSGLISGANISVNGLDNSKFDISAGAGVIVDYWTTPGSPVYYDVTIAAQTGVSLTYLATSSLTFIGVDKNGAIVQYNSMPTNEQRRDIILLAQIGHTNNTSIGAINPYVDAYDSPFESLRDLITELQLINDGNYISANGANLQLNKSNGYLFGNGVNFRNSAKNPNKINTPALSPASFRYRTQNGGATGTVNVLDVANYDNGGVITAIGGSQRASNQRVFLFPNNNIVIQYGQQWYNSLSAAIQGLESETFVTYENVEKAAILIGVISVTAGATALNNTSQAVFIPVSKFGEVTTGAITALSNYVPTSRTLTINGTAQDLSADRTWTVTATPRLNELLGANGVNTIDSATNAQTWTWNTLAGGNGLVLSSTSTAATSGTQTVLNVSLSGANSNANQTTYGARFSNTHTGSGSSNIAADFTASGGASNNYAINVSAGDVNLASGGRIRFAGTSAGIFDDGGNSLFVIYATASRPLAFYSQSTRGNIFYAVSDGLPRHALAHESATIQSHMFGGQYLAPSYIASGTTTATITRSAGKLTLCANTGTTAGNAFTPNEVLTINGASTAAASNVGIGTNAPNTNAKLEITSTTLIPLLITSMTSTQASALTPVNGGIVYVSDTNGTFTAIGFWKYENNTWVKF